VDEGGTGRREEGRIGGMDGERDGKDNAGPHKGWEGNLKGMGRGKENTWREALQIGLTEATDGTMGMLT